jgi:hypothetical protein
MPGDLPDHTRAPGAPMAEDLPEHVQRNRVAWDAWSTQYVADGEACWAAAEPRWGIWGVPEADLGLLPAELAGPGCH